MQRIQTPPFFALVCICLAAAFLPPPDQVRAESFKYSIPAGETREIRLQSPSEDRLSSLSIDNRSSLVVSDILIREASRDWTSPPRILATLLKESGAVSDRERTLVLFQYLCDHLGQDVYRSNWDCYDVWKAFNCYGAGHCEFHARVFSALLERMGIPCLEANLKTAPGQGGFGHTMVEVSYEGGWHLFDPHGKVFYLDGSNRNIAGWSELLKSPELFSRTRPWGEAFQGVDLDAWTRPDTQFWYDAKAARTFPLIGEPSRLLRLSPGDSLRYEADGTGVYIDNVSIYGPPAVPQSKATLTRRFPAPDRTWDAGSGRSGFEVLGSGSLFLDEARQGRFSVDIESPYPIAGATVTMSVRVEGGPSVKIRGGRTPLQDKQIEDLATWRPQSGSHWQVGLGKAVAEWNRPYASYAYRIHLEAVTDYGESVQIKNLQVETVCQVARGSLPRMEAGPWVVSASGQGTLEIGLETVATADAPPPPTVLRATRESGVGGGLELRWEQPGWEEPTWSEVQVSDDPRFRWNLSPSLGFLPRTQASRLSLSPSFLPETGEWHWRVRSLATAGASSGWSRTETVRFVDGRVH